VHPADWIVLERDEGAHLRTWWWRPTWGALGDRAVSATMLFEPSPRINVALGVDVAGWLKGVFERGDSDAVLER
jgi:hypothetical protein